MIPIPSLDNTTFKEIYEAMRRDANITDYSDPGDTITELYALLLDMQRFYMNQITDAHLAKYLELLKAKSALALEEDMNTLHRAVTAEDYKTLVLQKFPQLNPGQVNAVYDEKANRISVYADCNFTAKIREFLEGYRLIATELVVVPAKVKEFSIAANITFIGVEDLGKEQVKAALYDEFGKSRIGQKVTYGDVFRVIAAQSRVALVNSIEFTADGESVMVIQPTAGETAKLAGLTIESPNKREEK